MPILPLLATAATWLGRIGVAAFAVNEVAKLTGVQKDVMQQSTNEASNAGVSETEQKKLVAATTYDQVEQSGQNPDDFWSGLTPEQRAELKFSPETLRSDMQRTKFLGMSAALLFGASLFAAGVAAVRGVPIGLQTLAKLAEARSKGASALSLLTIIEEGKIAGINKVWVPGLIASIAAAGGWLSNSMVGNLNDATLWGRIFLGQAADDFEKAAKQRALTIGTGKATGTGQVGGGFAATATQTKTAKPKMFLGVVHAGRFADTPDFVRHVDDRITDDEDLRADVQINLTRWLASIADRLNYEVQVKFEPFDENNVRKPGTWLTMSLYYSGKGGKRIFIDEILLGPFDPVVYYPTSQISEAIRDVATKTLQPDMFAPTFSGDGRLEVITKEGERINIFPTQGTPSAAAAVQSRAPSVPPVSRMDSTLTLDQNIERGIIREGDFVPGFGVLTPLGTFDTRTWGAGTSPGISAPTVAVVPPTDQQLQNRLSPTSFTVAYPTDGMFRAVGSLGDSVWRRVGNRVYQASMLVPELIGTLSAYQNAGAQMQAATTALRTKYGIDWYALPTINIGDLASDQTLERTGRAGPDGGFDPFIRGATLQELVEVLGPQVNAGTRSTTLNG